MKASNQRIRYILYARKSSESEDRQVLSIESQIKELQNIARREGIEIIDISEESRSAKALGRPIFATMLERISKGEANGILCWKLDRLARNFIDGGRIIEMLQTGVLQHIRAYERSYYPKDNVLLMSVEFGMANQYSRDLAVNVERGLRTKAEMGWYPVQPPLGYLNTKTSGKGQNTIVKDPERFALVRKLWDLMLTGAYTPPQILEIATNEWGLRMRPHKKNLSEKMARSNIYHLLTSPFYYGQFEFPRGSGTWYTGSHEPMITIDEYDKVQVLLERKGRPRPKKHIFALIGTMRCAECGMSITAETKTKKQKNGNVHIYVYYHCTKRGAKCTQGVLEEKDLIAQVCRRLDEFEIPDQFHKWALKWLESENGKEATARGSALEAQQKAYNAIVQRIDRLIDMRAREELTEDEYRERKSAAMKEKERLSALLGNSDKQVDQWVDNMESAFDFIARAKEKFKNGSLETKRSIFVALGSNRLLKDRLVLLDMEETLLPMGKLAKDVRALHKRFEPQKDRLTQSDYEEIYSSDPTVSTLSTPTVILPRANHTTAIATRSRTREYARQNEKSAKKEKRNASRGRKRYSATHNPQVLPCGLCTLIGITFCDARGVLRLQPRAQCA